VLAGKRPSNPAVATGTKRLDLRLLGDLQRKLNSPKSNLPLTHGAIRASLLVVVSMNGSSVEGKEPHADTDRRALYDRGRVETLES